MGVKEGGEGGYSMAGGLYADVPRMEFWGGIPFFLTLCTCLRGRYIYWSQHSHFRVQGTPIRLFFPSSVKESLAVRLLVF